jgi:anti-sigma regulatory factor (Ser/Thr protein kinase)
MRTGAARGRAGHYHEAGFYSSDEEFHDLIVPFAEEGLAAGEPVIIGYDDRKNALLRSWLSDPAAVTFVGDKGLYATPARAIATYRGLFERHVGSGASQIRIAGDVPHPGNGGTFEGWDRYEAAVNAVWDEFPVWGLCLYDTSTAPAVVLDVVERTHPWIVSPSGQRRASDRYQGLSRFEALPVVPDPLERTTPTLELVDKPPAAARHAVAWIGRGQIDDAILDDLLIGVSEAVTNAVLYGRPPTTVRIWAAADSIVVSVHDRGRGPADPLAGLVPGVSDIAKPGLGLWLIHQLGIDVTLNRGDDGYAVRLRAGRTPE